ncbi:MAG: NUDIX domain-containing protein [Gemmataceae bacterium]
MVEKELGRPVSTAHIYKVSQTEPPRDATDGPPPMQQQALFPQTTLPNPFGMPIGPRPTNPVGSTPALPPASGTAPAPNSPATPTTPKVTGNVPNPEGNQAPVVVQGASELLNTVGGASAILELQKQYVAGAITRDMAIANATAIYGITRENVEALFPASVPIAKPVAEPTNAKGGSADQPAETFSEQEVTNFADVFVENEDGDILLLLRRDDDTFQPSTWCLPGGKIDAGETPEQAALRELEEETGLDVGRVRPFRSYPADNGGQSHVFVCKVHGKQDVKWSNEHTGYRWVGRDDESKIDYMLDTKQRIDDYFATTGKAEQFAEASDNPEVKVAIAGPDGQAAIHLTERAMADGRALLASLARDAVERRLKEGGAGRGPFFNEDERELLAEAIASTNATAELLGRYRIREQVQSNDSTVRFAAFDAADSPLRVKPIPPEEALRFFRELMPSMSLDPEFTDRHRRMSFTLAENTGEVMLRAVQDAITEALANGTTGTYAVQSILDTAGVTPRNPQYCFVPDTIVEGNVIAASKARYDGPVAKIQTDDGRTLSVTVNHPVLTTAGWKRAGDLQESDDLICYGRRVEPFNAGWSDFDGGQSPESSSSNFSSVPNTDTLVGSPSQRGTVNDQHAPSRIEDVYQSLSCQSTSREKVQSPVSPLDFYGDAAFFDGQVSCVWTDRELPSSVDAVCDQCGGQISFVQRKVFTSDSTREGIGLLNFRGGCSCDAGLIASKLTQNGSLLLGSNAFPPMTHAFGMASQLDASVFHSLDKRLGGDVKLASDLVNRLPVEVSTHRVVKIERVAFSGHVYDLQTTTTGFIVAQGIVTSNCDMVFRTNAIDAYNTGADDERQDPDVAEAFPVWQYLGIEDGRQGKDHEPHFGKYYPASVTFNQVRGDRPFNCRCSQRVVSKREWGRLQAAGARVEEGW